MITFAIITLVSGDVFINDTFQADDSKPGEVSAAFADCQAGARMLSPCLLMTESATRTTFTNVKTWYQLVVEK